MSKYQFVNIRFNIEKEEELELFNKLNPSNRAGNIKKILKQHYLLEDGDVFKKVQLESLIKEIVSSMSDENNPRNYSNKREIKNIESKGIKIIVGGRETRV